MVIHVKDDETDALVRQLAQSRGIGITAAIREAVEDALSADRSRSAKVDNRPLEERLKPLLERLDRLPRSPIATDKAFFDDAWGEGN
jgi:antitoxin VapB